MRVRRGFAVAGRLLSAVENSQPIGLSFKRHQRIVSGRAVYLSKQQKAGDSSVRCLALAEKQPQGLAAGALWHHGKEARL